MTALRAALYCALLALALSGCSSAAPAVGRDALGINTPQTAVEHFVDDFNQALMDSSLSQEARRRYWADRLASNFAPNERADQRLVLGEMLRMFVDNSQVKLADLAAANSVRVDSLKAKLELVYSSIEVVGRGSDRAEARLLDASLDWQVTAVAPNQSEQVLQSNKRPLAETIGRPDGKIPLLRTGGHWFLTE